MARAPGGNPSIRRDMPYTGEVLAPCPLSIRCDHRPRQRADEGGKPSLGLLGVQKESALPPAGIVVVELVDRRKSGPIQPHAHPGLIV